MNKTFEGALHAFAIERRFGGTRRHGDDKTLMGLLC